jgi:YesN/AraC family two-component response regulator
LKQATALMHFEKCKAEILDIVFLDEQMPGRSGLETLAKIKEVNQSLPVVLITKNETENLMDDAIGSQISDYLIKPVKPQQILLTLKKLLDNRRLVSEKTTSLYQQQFQQIFSKISMGLNTEEWADIYRKLIYWELELDNAKTADMRDVLAMQKSEANTEFCKFIIKNYKNWLNKPDDNTPTLSHTLMRHKILPFIEPGVPTFLLLIDNLRFDQWKVIQPLFQKCFA